MRPCCNKSLTCRRRGLPVSFLHLQHWCLTTRKSMSGTKEQSALGNLDSTVMLVANFGESSGLISPKARSVVTDVMNAVTGMPFANRLADSVSKIPVPLELGGLPADLARGIVENSVRSAFAMKPTSGLLALIWGPAVIAISRRIEEAMESLSGHPIQSEDVASISPSLVPDHSFPVKRDEEQPASTTALNKGRC